MISLLVMAALFFAAVIVIGALWTALGIVTWAVFLPFRILGWLIRGFFGLMIGIPLLLLFGFVALVVAGAGLIALVVPLLPLVALVAVIWWLAKRGRQSSASVTS